MEQLILYSSSFITSVLLNLLLWKLWNKKKIKIIQSKVSSLRWGSKSVPLVGGFSICLVLIISFLYIYFSYSVPKELIVVIVGGIAMFILGLVDDIFELKSYQKFIGQVVIVLVVITFGIRIELFGNMFDIPLSFLWIIGITNAINLLDNMDGLAGGISLIAAVFLGINFNIAGFYILSVFCFIIAISLLSFLIFNFKPAKIYLGDNGALLLGFILGAFTIIGANTSASGSSLFSVIIFPVVLLLIPICDTVFVSITRKLRGQSPFDGGKDHVSHRLVLLGMSERQAVIFLYIVSILLGLTIYIVKNVNLFTAIALYFFISIIILLFIVFIGKIKISSEKPSDKKTVVELKSNFLYKFNILKILIDIIIFGFVYYVSYLIRFGGIIEDGNLKLISESFALVIILKIILLNIFDAYRIDSKYFNINDFLKIIKSITAASIIVIIVLTFWIRFNNYARGVFVIDWALSIIILIAIRFSSCLLKEIFYSLRRDNIIKAIFIGDSDNFKLLESVIKIKDTYRYKLSGFININNYETGTLEVKDDIKLFIIEKKNKKKLNKKDLSVLEQKKIDIYELKDFICNVIDDKEV